MTTFDREATIMVSRVDNARKSNLDLRLHPTYETSIRIKTNENRHIKPHHVVKFFDQYRDLYEALKSLGIGEDQGIKVKARFPPKFHSSSVGRSLTEEQLQQRCYLLNKWVKAVFSLYFDLPVEAQKLLSDFFCLDAVEENKDFILSLLAEASINSESTKNTRKMSTSFNSSSSAKLIKINNLEKHLSTKSKNDIKQTILSCGFLSVLVLKGDYIQKHKEDLKSHLSFKILFRVLPLEESKINEKSEIDENHYNENVLRLKSFCIVKFFEDFRNLRLKLGEKGIFSRDDEKEFLEHKQFNQRILTINSKFPKTHQRSTLGLSLNENQINERVLSLNTWFCALLKLFKSQNPDIQDIISDFLNLPKTNKKQNLNDFLLDMLKDRFFLPRKQLKSSSFKIFTENQKNQELIKSSDVEGISVGFDTNYEDKHHPEDAPKERVINGFLTVIVELGDLITKTDGEYKLHNSFQIKLRIISVIELEKSRKENKDLGDFGKLSSENTHNVQFFFDKFRNLCQNLEQFEVYAKNSKNLENNMNLYKTEEVKNEKMSFIKLPSDNGILINSIFPPTFKVQKLGVKLSEKHLNSRLLGLNEWIGCLLQSFYALNSEAQELILRFLQLTPYEDKNFDKIIYSILKNDFQLPRLHNEDISPIGVKSKINNKSEESSSGNCCILM